MKRESPTRREFIRDGVAAGAAASVALSGMTAASYARAAGANTRIRVGQIGCGKRAGGHIREVHAAGTINGCDVTVSACCDIWKQRREQFPRHIEGVFKQPPKVYADYRELLDDRDIDAVVIATPDHQHCGQLIDAVGSGKDVYVEKPIGTNMEELNRAYDAVKASKAIVQNGTQGRSAPGVAAIREFLAGGGLGRLFRIETIANSWAPYWNFYSGPKTEAETDWKAFLYNRPDRPFDADQQAAWMGYHEFSSGPVGGWGSHFADFVHNVADCGPPRSAVTHGAIVAPTSDPRRTAPDNVTFVLEYPNKLIAQMVTHFGSGVDNTKTQIFGEKGILRCAFPTSPGSPVVSGEGSNAPDRIKKEFTINVNRENSANHHVANWIRCIQTRQPPVANMDVGYMHGVAVVLGDLAYVHGCKMVFDPEKREVRPA